MTRRGLGKGLSALIPGGSSEGLQPVARPAATPAADDSTPEGAQLIPLSEIRPNPMQPRQSFDEAEIIELAESMINHGVLQPIVVRMKDDGYEIIAGERRWRAAQRSGLTKIPAMVKTTDDRESLEISLIENLQRENINPMEAARAYQRLSREFSLTQEQIAQRLGKSRPAIANTLRLLDLPEDVGNSLAEGKISEGHAKALLSLADAKAMRSICKQIIARNLSVRDLESLIKKLLSGKPSARRASKSSSIPADDPNLLAVEEQLRQKLQTNIQVRPATPDKDGTRAGVIQIEYYSADEFERILELLLR